MKLLTPFLYSAGEGETANEAFIKWRKWADDKVSLEIRAELSGVLVGHALLNVTKPCNVSRFEKKHEKRLITLLLFLRREIKLWSQEFFLSS